MEINTNFSTFKKLHKNGTQRVAIFDSNWGMFEKDVQLADHILKVMEKNDWQKEFIYFSG